MKHHYDVIVIGAGSGGLTAAVGFSKVGKKVLLIEREQMGGECTNSGCIPSKALLHHAKTYYAAKQIFQDSQPLENYRQEALRYVQSKITAVRKEEEPDHFRKMGIDVVLGEAVFEAPCKIRVRDDVFGFRTAVIATGSSPHLIDIDGLRSNDILTNQNIFQLREIPEKLLIVGAGPIGMELGQAFAMLGSRVTIVSREKRFASREDEAISPIIQKKFESLGITILLESELRKVRNGVGHIDTQKKNSRVHSQAVPFDKVLLAIGRVPNFPEGLVAAGIQSDKKCILVDGQYRTSNKDVYAVGDVALALKFTHTADDSARQVVTRVVSRKILRVNTKKSVPRAIYTSPPIASVGFTDKEACDKYDCNEIFRIEVPYKSNDRAKTDDETEGLLIVVVRRLNGVVLGATIIGNAADELISFFTLAIDEKRSMWKLRSLIFPYPTYSLLIKKAGDIFLALTLENLKTDILYLVKKHLPKVVALCFWAVLLYAFHEYRASRNLSVKEMLVMIYDFVTGTTWGPVVYMLVYAFRPLIFFPATLLTALSGLLFGLPLGVLYTVIGENASANLAYWIGRFFGGNLKLEDSFIGRSVEGLRRQPFLSVLFMRLFYVPFDLTNYGSGILRVRWSSYALATAIGIMPGLVTFVALGAGIKDIRSFELSAEAFDFVSIGIAFIVFTASLFLSRYLRRWHAQNSES